VNIKGILCMLNDYCAEDVLFLVNYVAMGVES